MKDKRADGLTRREFLKTTCMTVGGLPLFLALLDETHAFGELTQGRKAKPRPLVRLAFVRSVEPPFCWPGAGYPFKERERLYEKALRGMAAEFGIDLSVRREPLATPEETKRFGEDIKANPPDALIVINHHCFMWDRIETLVGAGVKTIVYAPVGTGFTWQMQPFTNRPKVWLVSSTELSGVKDALKAVKAGKLMQESRLLVIHGEKEETTHAEPLGTELVVIPAKRYVEELGKVSGEAKEVRALAEAYRKMAKKIVEPKGKELIDAARTYFAHRKLMDELNADAVATDCLRIGYPWPCLGFTHLRDERRPAGCEADVDATLTMMLCQYLLDRPSFMGNPVFDTVRQLLVTAHCVSPLRLDGFGAKPAPFIFRSHLESHTGVALQVLWKVGQRVTVLRFLGAPNLMFGAGTVVENLDTPPWGTCRTSVAVKLDDVDDLRKLRGFHHQVLVYGEHTRLLRCYAQLHGLNALTLYAGAELFPHHYAHAKPHRFCCG